MGEELSGIGVLLGYLVVIIMVKVLEVVGFDFNVKLF